MKSGEKSRLRTGERSWSEKVEGSTEKKWRESREIIARKWRKKIELEGSDEYSRERT